MAQLFFLVKHLFSLRSQYHGSTSVYKGIAIVPGPRWIPRTNGQ